jgi:hypothetical protein
MVAEARAVGVPIGEIVARIEHLSGPDGLTGEAGRDER